MNKTIKGVAPQPIPAENDMDYEDPLTQLVCGLSINDDSFAFTTNAEQEWRDPRSA